MLFDASPGSGVSKKRSAMDHFQAVRYFPRTVGTPCVSVLDSSGRVIEAEQRALLRHIVQEGFGCDILFVLSNAGEWSQIAQEQRRRLMELAVEEVRALSAGLAMSGHAPLQVWLGVTALSRKETLDNLRLAASLKADAAVVAPLAMRDLARRDDLLAFFQRDVSSLFESLGSDLPLFLYDNAELPRDPSPPHIHTHDVKVLARLLFLYGLVVSGSKREIGNYFRGATHFKAKGQFGIYLGQAMMMFDIFLPGRGFWGRFREHWDQWLLQEHMPFGVMASESNLFPCEWRTAWALCQRGDRGAVASYREIFERFSRAFSNGSKLRRGGRAPFVACCKAALKADGVISSDSVAPGSPSLTSAAREKFLAGYRAIKDRLKESAPGGRLTRTPVPAR
jgi:dihydrodipicolinate synthase/N-acetylneuraminate lyase